jgi:rhodanese-related sulfurtransferase
MRFENINIRYILASALSHNAIMVDVRTPDKFRKGHIPMSVNLPLSDIQNNKVSFPKNRTLIVYCDNGGSSMQAARLLSDMGYEVINCIGGIKNYKGALTKNQG